jgi:hypothetical protein
LSGIQAEFQAARAALARLEPYLASETRLTNELLEPTEAAMESYRVRYLQLFDEVTAVSEQTRQRLDQLPQQPAYRALSALAQLPPLGGDPRPQLQALIAAAKTKLFPEVTRAAVVAQLRDWPEPPACPLTLQNGGEKWPRRKRFWRRRQRPSPTPYRPKRPCCTATPCANGYNRWRTNPLLPDC